ncbi:MULTISPECIES: UDP-2,3-diacylglucosamine diphosphatase [Methylococcus]|uniref:UDP-2,3-diacylglucosamine diphosphatase n=1 Tax=Methylococcus capsulatus TaxID=414 RepID=A0ABZ2F681_METCP|nr:MULTISPECIES: UDP-2,3-diacylglucosamine diphosphatase [Methylococcus]MDF9393369.1 UDP-2,3-diacylglucosamine diphosphatase [Methylococcus capsulatus]
MSLDYRTVWISDVHLGTRGCKAEYLVDFLKNVRCDTLYLVGDILDLWKLKSGWHWPPMHSEILRTVMDRAKRGVRVVYVPGNHDEMLRDYTGSLFGGVEVVDRAVHETQDGRRLLVLHGDEFDGVVCSTKWLAVLGSEAYEVLLACNRWFNWGRRRLGFPYWSLSAFIKHKVKNAVNVICRFEEVLMHEAASRGLDGVVCGHIHHAALREIDGLTYANCGDWVESCTALVETAAGELKVVRWVEESAFLLEDTKRETGTDKRRLATAG